MEKFKFILSKEKFAEIGDTDDIGDEIYEAELISKDAYLVRYFTEDGWTGWEYTKSDVETNLEQGFWLKVNG